MTKSKRKTNKYLIVKIIAQQLKKIANMPQVTFKIQKQAPKNSVTNGSSENLELFHGIGNTLGMNITGGIDFEMPITVFHVSYFFSMILKLFVVHARVHVLLANACEQ